MSRFTSFTSVQIPCVGDPYYTLTEDLVYERFYEGSKIYIITPAGTKTDFASFPNILRIFFDKGDSRWIKSSIIHDYLFSKANTLVDYKIANDVFYESMQVEGTPKYLANIFYVGVTFGGFYYYIIHSISKYINKKS